MPDDRIGARGSVLSALRALENDRTLSECVVAHRVTPPAEARFADLPPGLDPRLPAALQARGVRRLYVHQREAYDRVVAHQDVVVVTPTASGKTLCYNLPVLD